MPSLLNIYQKYKKGGGVRGKSIKVTSTIDSSSSNDITDNDIQTIKQLVNKLNLNVKLNSFENECNQYIIQLNNDINTTSFTQIEDLTCYNKYLQIYQDPKANITDKLKQLYESQKTDYKKITCYLDGYDIFF